MDIVSNGLLGMFTQSARIQTDRSTFLGVSTNLIDWSSQITLSNAGILFLLSKPLHNGIYPGSRDLENQYIFRVFGCMKMQNGLNKTFSKENMRQQKRTYVAL
jgi:hypothetical protein